MVFSSLIFIYSFLPLVLILNYLFSKEYRNPLLLIASLIFFAWGGVSYTLILIISVSINYFVGILIHSNDGKPLSRLFLSVGILLDLGILGVFKYTGFLIENINYFLKVVDKPLISDPGIILPLGISFYTFQAMSYIMDVYRKDAVVQKNIFKLGLYITFFPQLIAGPIVRYQTIADQLTKRRNHRANFMSGIQRFTLGLVKKVIFANQFGLVADKVFALPSEELNLSTSWIGILAYTFQIYFDFSGYSDMAIGLGKMFGFRLPENFNFPYTSASVREFWQRWHITLSSWFRNYLYFPLGGSHVKPNRVAINLLIVFFATSIWHGSSWTFVVWGMSHGVFMMLERIGLNKILTSLWRPLQHAYLLLVVVNTWVFFRADTISYGWEFLKTMYSFKTGSPNNAIYPVVVQDYFIILTILAVMSSTKIWIFIGSKLKPGYINFNNNKKRFIGYTFQTTYSFCIILLLAICSMLLVSDSYNPFIYFRF